MTIQSSFGMIYLSEDSFANPQPLQLPSTSFVNKGMNQGLFGGKNEISKVLLPEFKKEDEMVDQSYHCWHSKSKETADKFHEITIQQIEHVLQGGQISEADEQRRQFVRIAAEEDSKRYFEIATQALYLANVTKKQRLGDYLEKIEAIFQARLKDIQLVKSQLEILQMQENHALKIEIAHRNAILQEESHKFDQCLKKAQFFADKEQKEFENRMEERKQSHAERIDVKRIALEEKKIDQDNERANKMLDYEQEYRTKADSHQYQAQMAGVNAQRETATAQINSQNRIAAFEQLVGLASQMNRLSLAQSNQPTSMIANSSMQPVQSNFSNHPLTTPNHSFKRNSSGNKPNATPSRSNNLDQISQKQLVPESSSLRKIVAKSLGTGIELSPWLLKRTLPGFLMSTGAQALGVGEKIEEFLTSEKGDFLLNTAMDFSGIGGMVDGIDSIINYFKSDQQNK